MFSLSFPQKTYLSQAVDISELWQRTQPIAEFGSPFSNGEPARWITIPLFVLIMPRESIWKDEDAANTALAPTLLLLRVSEEM